MVVSYKSHPVLVSGWSDNGWLSGGHAVRMAMELCKSLYNMSQDINPSDTRKYL